MEFNGEPSDEAGDLLRIPFRPPYGDLGSVGTETPEWWPQRLGGKVVLGVEARLEDSGRAFLLADFLDDRLSKEVRFSGEQHEEGTTVRDVFPNAPDDLEGLDDPLPEKALERRSKREALREDLPPVPLHSARYGALRNQGQSESDIRQATVVALALLPEQPERDKLLDEQPVPKGHPTHPDDGVWLLCHRLFDYFNAVVPKLLLGPDARQKLRADEDSPRDGVESLDAPLDESGGETLHDRLGEEDERFAARGIRAQVRRLVDRGDLLTDGEREAVLHRKVYGRSAEETAEEMDSTPASVHSLTSKALKKLRGADDMI